jgi:phosphatidylinositol-3,4,5-trisphosphate 3-phosphatase/dual-specificity protein phosphatase PTEN
MGFPSEGKEAMIRNPMQDVQSFLEENHRQHYRVYNLCSEKDRQYDAAKFENRVASFGFEDHKAPPLPLLLAACQ